MKRKNGFFSMSLIYSVFLVFAMLSAILLANYAHNRLLVKDYNVDIKGALDFGMKAIMITNKDIESDGNYKIIHKISELKEML